MRYYQEVTEWNTDYTVPSHIYYLKDDRTRAVGYIPHGKKKLVKFSKPMSFDVRGRKFVEVMKDSAEADSVYFGKPEVKQPAQGKQVQGSNGKIYYLTKNVNSTYTCTCPGYMFRRKCRHITEVS